MQDKITPQEALNFLYTMATKEAEKTADAPLKETKPKK